MSGKANKLSAQEGTEGYGADDAVYFDAAEEYDSAILAEQEDLASKPPAKSLLGSAAGYIHAVFGGDDGGGGGSSSTMPPRKTAWRYGNGNEGTTPPQNTTPTGATALQTMVTGNPMQQNAGRGANGGGGTAVPTTTATQQKNIGQGTRSWSALTAAESPDWDQR